MKTFKEFVNEAKIRDTFELSDADVSKIKRVMVAMDEPMSPAIASSLKREMAKLQKQYGMTFKEMHKLVNEAIKTDFDLQKYIEDLAILVDRSDKPRARKIRLAAEKLEMDSSNRDYQSELTSLLGRLPNDKMIIKLADAIEDYLETL